jgi:uncharacterized repeat protein (TIGR03806 family)
MTRSRREAVSERRSLVIAFSLALLSWAGPAAAVDPTVALELVTDGVSTPTYVWNAGDDRLFILERQGLIRIYREGEGLLPTPFLDLTASVVTAGEGGLYAMAFDPNFATNERFFVSYAGPLGANVVSRFELSADPDVADPASELVFFTVPQPGITHNGGQIAFGPNDGYLYMSFGDGGGSGDVNCHAQRPDVFLGKILRIDVSQFPYTVPPDNPFVGDPGDVMPDEVWALGLRNPWRFSFDTATGDLLIGDVGQDSREEFDHQLASSPGGENYGWRVMEGTKCHDPDPIDPDCPVGTPSCDDPSYTAPIHEFTHGGALGICAGIGGFVYRGSGIEGLQGRYIFGELCSASIWSLEQFSPGMWGNLRLLVNAAGTLRSFGQDAQGELYAAINDEVYRLVPGSGARPQSRAQQTCINAMNRQGSDVVKVRGRANVDCINFAARGKLAQLGLTDPGATVADCIAANVKNRIQNAADRVALKEARKCRDPAKPEQVPDFAYTSTGVVVAAAVSAANRLTESLMGTDPDAPLVLQADDPAGARCQRDVAHRVRVVLDQMWQLARTEKRKALAATPSNPPVGLPEDLAVRVLAFVDADPRQLVQRKVDRVAAVAGDVCGGQPLDQLFPGDCAGSTATPGAFAGCLEERARCHLCRSFEAFDGLDIDCDTFDDSDPDGSCPTQAEILCAAGSTGVNFAASGVDCPSLLQYRLFTDPGDPTDGADGGVPFDLTTPLFSDYALKYRFVFLPPGTQATYDADAPFDFPVGTIIAKTFSFADDLRDPGAGETVIETRLLIRRELGWEGLPYIWLPDMTDAILTPEGGSAAVSWIDAAGDPQSTTYEIPSAIECGFCHFDTGDGPIGPKARLLNRDYPYAGGTANQIDHWSALGILAGAPPAAQAPRLPVWDDPADGTLEERARAYLESNCAHCHNPDGRSGFTGLWFEHDQPLDESYGICKEAGDGGAGVGLTYAIVPGDPAQSVAVFRMSVTSDGIKMPELERSVVHQEGVDLVSTWIQGLAGTCQ